MAIHFEGGEDMRSWKPEICPVDFGDWDSNDNEKGGPALFYQCTLGCATTCQHEYTLRLHEEEVHYPQRGWACKIDPRHRTVFRSRQGLRLHLRRTHKLLSVDEYEEGTERDINTPIPQWCGFCGQTMDFRSPKDRVRHMVSHFDEGLTMTTWKGETHVEEDLSGNDTDLDQEISELSGDWSAGESDDDDDNAAEGVEESAEDSDHEDDGSSSEGGCEECTENLENADDASDNQSIEEAEQVLEDNDDEKVIADSNEETEESDEESDADEGSHTAAKSWLLSVGMGLKPLR
jgi:hypothetical protein